MKTPLQTCVNELLDYLLGLGLCVCISLCVYRYSPLFEINLSLTSPSSCVSVGASDHIFVNMSSCIYYYTVRVAGWQT